MSNRTWTEVHRRGEVLRAIVDEANSRRDGVLPMDLPGVAETFGDDYSVVTALQLRWHTRLSGRIERAMMDQPLDLEVAVVDAWRTTARELVGVRRILDAYTAHPSSEKMADALNTAHRKDWDLLAVMAGKASIGDERAVHVGRGIEEKARAAYNPAAAPRRRVEAGAPSNGSLLGRLKSVLAA